ncbi:hypothetical protein [Selenomonas ruminantium]|nr:hypothetical protein [Selenomonas ruminantium]
MRLTVGVKKQLDLRRLKNLLPERSEFRFFSREKQTKLFLAAGQSKA